MTVLRNAFLLAVEKHKNQKYGDNPYIVHLRDVEIILREFGVTNEDYLAAAWLHDVIEDTATHYSEVKQKTNTHVAEMVFALTDEIGRNRKERKQKTLPKLHACKDAILVKLADWIANLRDARANNPGFLQMYKKDFPDFKTACYDLVKSDTHEAMWQAAESILHRGKKGP